MKKKSVQSGNPFKSVILTFTKGHNGHLEVETEEGMGTRFVVSSLDAKMRSQYFSN